MLVWDNENHEKAHNLFKPYIIVNILPQFYLIRIFYFLFFLRYENKQFKFICLVVNWMQKMLPNMVCKFKLAHFLASKLIFFCLNLMVSILWPVEYFGANTNKSLVVMSYYFCFKSLIIFWGKPSDTELFWGNISLIVRFLANHILTVLIIACVYRSKLTMFHTSNQINTEEPTFKYFRANNTVNKCSEHSSFFKNFTLFEDLNLVGSWKG